MSQFEHDQDECITCLKNDNATLVQQYGELQEAARKVIRYWGIKHESYLQEYIRHMDSVIQKHIQGDQE